MRFYKNPQGKLGEITIQNLRYVNKKGGEKEKRW